MDNIFVFSLSNGRDIIADASDYLEPASNLKKFGELHLPEVMLLHKPRIIMMQPSSSGIRVGMAPVDVDDINAETKIPFNTQTISYCYRVSSEGNLAKNYKTSLSAKLGASETATPVTAPTPAKPAGKFRAG